MRGIAILLVVLNHTISLGIQYHGQSGYPPIQGLARQMLYALELLGWFAVPIFLFISGSFFAYAAQGNPPRLTYRVVWENLKHILWPYVIWSMVFYLWVWMGHDQSSTPLGTIKNLVVGYPFHFVPLIIFYYLISPILIWLLNRIPWQLILGGLAVYQVILMNLVEPGILGFLFPPWAEMLSPPIIARTMADWGIYFPLGLIYALNMKKISPAIEKFSRVFLILTLIFFGLTVAAAARLIPTPWARYVYPLMFVLYLPSIQRSAIPFIHLFEDIGKRAYGLYLTHLTLLDILLFAIQVSVPGFFGGLFLLLPVFYLLAVLIPMGLMTISARLPSRNMFRIVFG